MNTSLRRYVAIQLISVFRLFAALLFAMIAFQSYSIWIVIGIYLLAAISDVLDGFFARRLSLDSFAGKVIDLISDKSLTIVSLLYAAAREVTLFPLAVIAARDLITLGLRLIVINNVQLLPTSRIFGGWMAVLLWGNTILLILSNLYNSLYDIAVWNYWLCATIFAVNLILRFIIKREQIMDFLVMESKQNQTFDTISEPREKRKATLPNQCIATDEQNEDNSK